MNFISYTVTCDTSVDPFLEIALQLTHMGDKENVKLLMCLHHAMKAYCGSGGIASRIIDLGTRWKWVINFTPRPLYHQGKSPRYPLDRGLGGPQSPSGRGGEEKNSQPPPGHEHSLALYHWVIPTPDSTVLYIWQIWTMRYSEPNILMVWFSLLIHIQEVPEFGCSEYLHEILKKYLCSFICICNSRVYV
jgi:hypothetical protein